MPPTDDRRRTAEALSTVEVVSWRGERARLEVHRHGRDGSPVTTVHPDHDRPLSAGFVGHCLELLTAVGGAVLSPALGLGEVAGFEQAGFGTRADLHLLVHDLAGLPPRPLLAATTVRRGGDRDVAAVLAVDAAAFPQLWQLDRQGLAGALGATPSVRYRVAVDAAGQIVGYAITGRAGRRGYLQRLAVQPGAQGAGIGRNLVIDGLAWCRRWRVRRVAVNTQHGNAPALHLYRQLGFVEAASGLRVMQYHFAPGPTGGSQPSNDEPGRP